MTDSVRKVDKGRYIKEASFTIIATNHARIIKRPLRVGCHIIAQGLQAMVVKVKSTYVATCQDKSTELWAFGLLEDISTSQHRHLTQHVRGRV